ncbi:MAG TPA: RlmE family RNA methyltransferase [Phycisphaerales bacterium]|nr:RlmE family RNA methyltransferase [Phycisphaerales bacterium]
MARRKLHDKYFKQAKREGYLARSAYKLIELDDRRRLLRPGDTVLDLGCAPGSWLQVAAERVGPRGRVVGIDLNPVAGSFGPNVRTIVGDFTEIDPAALLDDGRPANVVLSDMAPKTTGHGDHFHSVRLCERIVAALPVLLRPGGSLVMKVFEGEAFPPLLAEVRALFRDVKTIKPRATREMSRETYITAKRYRPPREQETGDNSESGGRGAKHTPGKGSAS